MGVIDSSFESPQSFASGRDMVERLAEYDEEASMASIDAALKRKPVYLGDPPARAKKAMRRVKSLSIEHIAFLASLAFNIVLSLALIGYYYRLPPHALSKYAKLPHTTTAYNFSTMYGPLGLEDESHADDLWDANAFSGLVAIETGKAKSLGLPRAQALPWDESSRVYTISGMHSMQCLRKVRRSIKLSQYARQQLDSYSELLYCLDILRQDVLCHADDTLISTSNTGMNFYKGDGQQRVCRDWKRLVRWYESNKASANALEGP